MMVDDHKEDIICLDESFFINDDYIVTSFKYGDQVLDLLCLQSASTDYDLTGQLVWPGAEILNNYLSSNRQILHGCSVIELGSGVGVTGLLCSRFCHKILLTDHNDEVLKLLKKNIETHSGSSSCQDLGAEKLEWGNVKQLKEILERHPKGFDIILGADICFQHSSIPLLFDTVKQLLLLKRGCKFLLAYVSRAKIQLELAVRWCWFNMDGFMGHVQFMLIMHPTQVPRTMSIGARFLPAGVRRVKPFLRGEKRLDELVLKEATQHALQVTEIQGTRSEIRNLQGVVYEITLQNILQ